MSWNFGFRSDNVFEDAYELAAEAGVMSFNSAGNNHLGRIAMPGSLPTVHAIPAVDSTGARMFVRSGFGSNIGDEAAFSGPGRYIPTADVMGDFGYSEVETIPTTGTTSSPSPGPPTPARWSPRWPR